LPGLDIGEWHGRPCTRATDQPRQAGTGQGTYKTGLCMLHRFHDGDAESLGALARGQTENLALREQLLLDPVANGAQQGDPRRLPRGRAQGNALLEFGTQFATTSDDQMHTFERRNRTDEGVKTLVMGEATDGQEAERTRRPGPGGSRLECRALRRRAKTERHDTALVPPCSQR